jgi:outer membrane biosynthesis protein TonB
MTYVVRVPGEGKIILIVKEDGAALTIARTETKTNHSWDEIKAAWAESMECGDEQGNTFINAKAAYEYTYGKPIEEIPEVAPVQPKRVEAPKVEKPKKEKKPEKASWIKEQEKATEEKEEAAGVSPEVETAEEPVVIEEAVAIPIEEEPAEEPKKQIDSTRAREYIEIALGALENGSFTQCEEYLTTALEEVRKLKEEIK